MVRKDLAQLGREELIDIVLAQFEQITQLRGRGRSAALETAEEPEAAEQFEQFFAAAFSGSKEQPACET